VVFILPLEPPQWSSGLSADGQGCDPWTGDLIELSWIASIFAKVHPLIRQGKL